MRTLDLDALLGDRHPRASFHDSELEAIAIDFVGRVARLDFGIRTDCDDPDDPIHRGVLELRDLHAFAAETPREASRESHLWITSDGPWPDPRARIELEMPTGLPEEAFCHYLFANNTNSFILFAANVADFTWHEGDA